MKAKVEVSFANPAIAKRALGVLKIDAPNDKVEVKMKAVGSEVIAEFEAKSFASLRARVTSFFRDVRVFMDAVSLVKKGG